jgi:hypothetical protein
LEILARELGMDWVEVNLSQKGSNVLKSDNRQLQKGGKGGRA